MLRNRALLQLSTILVFTSKWKSNTWSAFTEPKFWFNRFQKFSGTNGCLSEIHTRFLSINLIAKLTIENEARHLDGNKAFPFGKPKEISRNHQLQISIMESSSGFPKGAQAQKFTQTMRSANKRNVNWRKKFLILDFDQIEEQNKTIRVKYFKSDVV